MDEHFYAMLRDLCGSLINIWLDLQLVEYFYNVCVCVRGQEINKVFVSMSLNFLYGMFKFLSRAV